jgi:hypothetical protein
MIPLAVNLDASIPVGKRGKVLFKKLIDAAICMVVDSESLNIFLFIQRR